MESNLSKSYREFLNNANAEIGRALPLCTGFIIKRYPQILNMDWAPIFVKYQIKNLRSEDIVPLHNMFAIRFISDFICSDLKRTKSGQV